MQHKHQPQSTQRPDYWLDTIIIALDESAPTSPWRTWLRLAKHGIEVLIFDREEVLP
jgi:hypothetical protein